MANLNPFNSVFTTLGILVASGTKVTMSILNQIVNNTGYNWLGGRHPMRESYGLSEIVFPEIIDEDTGNPVAPDTIGEYRYEPVDLEVSLSDRASGVTQFTHSQSYHVFISDAFPFGLSYVELPDIENGGGSGSEDTAMVAEEIPYQYVRQIDVVEKTPTKFTIRYYIPRVTSFPLSTINVEWHAKGW